MFAQAFLLSRPWALYAAEGSDTQRIDLHDGESVSLPAGCGLYAVTTENLKLTFSGRRQLTAQQEGGSFTWKEPKKFWSLPNGSSQDEGRFSLLVESDNGIETAEIRLEDAVADTSDTAEDSPSGKQKRLLLALIDHVRTLVDDELHAVDYHAVGRKHIGTSVPWATAEEVWCRDASASDIPPRDIIVHQAETMQRTLETLANHPRRVLNRIRERLPIGRLEELDSACLEWYVRQPGRTALEKAGSRQSLLGVARQETFNTLENRVLRAYLRLAARASSSYVALYGELRQSDRMLMVERFRRLCRLLDRDLAALGVTLPSPPILPNYVLQQDPSYRRVWQCYLALMKREEDKDNIWRWQGRLWSEFTRLSVLVALRGLPGATILAETPLLIMNDQQRGRWVDLSAHPAVICVPIEGRLLVATVIDAQARDAAQFGGEDIWGYLWSIGPSCVIHAEDVDSGKETWVVIWGIHPIDGKEMDLRQEAICADGALKALRERIRLEGGGRVNLRGIVMVSHPSLDGESGMSDFGDTMAYRSSVSALSLKGMIGGLADMLPYILAGA